MIVKQILDTLDKNAEVYEFPVLDNCNFDLSQCALSVYRNDDKWVIIIQVVGVDPNLEIANHVYTYSNFVYPQGFTIAVNDLVSLPDEEDWYDDDDSFLVNPLHLKLMVNDKIVEENPKEDDYRRLGIEIVPYTPTKLARYLSSKYKNELLLSDGSLRKELTLPYEFKRFYHTEEWNHTDEEKPSENEFFRSLAKAIEEGDSGLIKYQAPNTHWSNWTWSDFDSQEDE
ncbi:hypothetical protein bcgnr5378_05470 [Bacillus cereus]|uniref:Group-specific protein n=1 Tax=Bacillus cereus TaxID=1396 RepID=A0A162NWF0_BACCE|nr:hypothetical protein [Bacillus cereus]KZD55673.1 group-specific protein [Bacillus cereus]